ncbi:hypothetical protein BurJ1DRAFT_1885 [Burkholderiales bacterium JOSHI_001]|nr:hypothetical protein BurJ1DRAFT_1885 [Burkholderiales bacterium JOSHI_001]
MAAALSNALAQKVPAPSRTVFRCDEGGKTVYSDAPCLGARKIDIQPTRGLNKATGKELIGADVRREHQHEAIVDAVRPATGMNLPTFDRASRRMKLSAGAQRECKRLDKEIPVAEEAERQPKRPAEQKAVREQLHALRVEFHKFGC